MHTTTRRPPRATVQALLTTTTFAVMSLFSPAPAAADEGMWLLDQPPHELLEKRFGLSLAPSWFEHQQKAALRLSSGGSGSFVSADGLALTNHHVVLDQLAKLSSAEHDLIENGFLATSREMELATPDLQVLTLWQIEDVTAEVKKAGAGLSSAEAGAARRASINEIEQRSQEETGLHSEVVTLYGGGLYHLYRYKRYTDVRLVFVPEEAVAAFGGDVDNFEFPRFCLDMALLRVYEDGEPVRPEHFLQLTTDGVAEGDPVFTFGHPGSTQRAYTVEHLRFLRDTYYPAILRFIRNREVELLVFSSRDKESRRQAESSLASYQNGRKGLGGKLRALQDPRVFKRKIDEEEVMRRAVADDPALAAVVGDAWQAIADAQAVHREIHDRYLLLERFALGRSELFGIALDIVRLTAELERPNADRLPEYSESRLPSLERELYSEAPLERELEIDHLTSGLAYMAEVFGAEDELVAALLAGTSPSDRARQLVDGTGLAAVEARRELVAAGTAGIAASSDPLIALARLVDGPARRLRQRYEDEVEAVEENAYAQLATARFKIFGQAVYPDATFTLRMSLGRVAGFPQEGQPIAPLTTLGGMYARGQARGQVEPFALPARWNTARQRLALDTPFNFVSTNDIIGGNSGSPVVDRQGRLVGLIFDGNRYSFAWDTIFSDEAGRAVSVDSRAIIEALQKVYKAKELAAELAGPR